MNELQRKILDISKRLDLAHIGSNLSCLPILRDIYENKHKGDKVILDNAHAHLAHAILQELYEEIPDAEWSVKDNGIHCDRKSGCDASGGSLGHGLGIAIGYALADKTKTVHVIVSDGSMMEGSNWEALRIISDKHIKNIHIYCNFNGYTAVAKVYPEISRSRIEKYLDDETVNITYYNTDNTKDFWGVQGHYKKL